MLPSFVGADAPGGLHWACNSAIAVLLASSTAPFGVQSSPCDRRSALDTFCKPCTPGRSLCAAHAAETSQSSGCMRARVRARASATHAAACRCAGRVCARCCCRCRCCPCCRGCWYRRRRALVCTHALALAHAHPRALRVSPLFPPQTGDTSLNPEGSIVIMTTEILRNIMYRTAETTGPGGCWLEPAGVPCGVALGGLSVTAGSNRAAQEGTNQCHPSLRTHFSPVA